MAVLAISVRAWSVAFSSSSFLQKSDGVVETELFGPCYERAVARDFVVLDRLGRIARSKVARRGQPPHGTTPLWRCYTCAMSAQTKDRSQASLDRVWDIIEKVGVCMLTTQFAGGLRARPLEARPDRNAGVIWFVTDKRSSKEHEIEAEHDVALVLHPFARSLGPCSIPAFLRSAFSP
jgi:hypothetical protein